MKYNLKSSQKFKLFLLKFTIAQEYIGPCSPFLPSGVRAKCLAPVLAGLSCAIVDIHRVQGESVGAK